jgi:chromosomal replication initiation ATPase DnaA
MNYQTGHQAPTANSMAGLMQQPLQSNMGTSKPEQMLHLIAKALNMSPENFRLRSRERNIVELRFLGALFLRRNFPFITLQQIAALYGGQDHSSVISGLARAYDLISCGDARFVQKYNIVSQKINLWLHENS